MCDFDSLGMSGELPLSTVTLRLPADTCERLKQMAFSRGISLDKLMEEFATAAIAAHDAEVRFRAMATGADRQRALAVLDQLDAVDQARAS